MALPWMQVAVERTALREIVKIAAIALRCVENRAPDGDESINKS